MKKNEAFYTGKPEVSIYDYLVQWIIPRVSEADLGNWKGTQRKW